MMENVLSQHIETTPDIVGGKPHIAGKLITVQDIVRWHEQMGMRAEDIAAESHITLGDVYAALAYYFDHPTEIDESIRSDEEWMTNAQSFQEQPSNFWNGMELEELARQQHVNTIRRLEDLQGKFMPADESVDTLIETVRKWREQEMRAK
jgi:uncharacterized protein (DUF433 family)